MQIYEFRQNFQVIFQKLSSDRKKAVKIQFCNYQSAVVISCSKIKPGVFLHKRFLKVKRIAIPIADNILSEHFGGCHYYEIFEIEGYNIQKKTLEIPDVNDISELPAWLEKQGVTDVIAYKVNKQIITLFASNKVNLFVGIPQHTTEKLIDDYLYGKLESDKTIIEEITN
jgi:predicted Fe-Mo cluster-binding NifX family protein